LNPQISQIAADFFICVHLHHLRAGSFSAFRISDFVFRSPVSGLKFPLLPL
jgi:hypothetical protein